MITFYNIITAVIPVTDSDHKLLPLHFSFDPGPDFEWENFASTTDPNSMSYNPSYNPCLGIERKESENLDLLKSYLELVKVPLPEWLVDHSEPPMQQATPSPTQPPIPASNIPSNQPQQDINPNLTYSNQIVAVAYSEPNYVVDVNYVEHHNRRNQGCRPTYRRSKTSKQIQSVAKQFGSIGKKLKKNLGNFSKGALSRKGSFRGGKNVNYDPGYIQDGSRNQNHWTSDDHLTDSSGRSRQQNQRKIVSGSQSFILGAVIHTTNKILPYQNAMVQNYLQEASHRFNREAETKEKVRQEQIEEAEKRQREIYLNGGFVDCVNSGCQGQGTSETSYLCKPCFAEQQSMRQNSNVQNKIQHHQPHDDNVPFPVVNDSKRITTIVKDKNASQDRYSSRMTTAGNERNRQMINDNFHPSTAGPAVNGPIVASFASNSLITAGGIVGVGTPSDASHYHSTDKGRIPFRGENNTTADYPKTDNSLTIGQPLSTYGKPSSLVSATAKISSATTEVYQKNGETVERMRNGATNRIGLAKENRSQV